MFLIRFKQTQPRPDGSGNREGQNGGGNQNSGEEKKSGASAECDPGVEAGGLIEGPTSEAVGDPAQEHHREGVRKPRGPVVDAEDSVGYSHHPVVERGLFEIGDTVEAGGDPVSGCEHGAGSLCLDCIHVVHETGRAADAYEEDEASRGGNGPTGSSNSKSGFGILISSRGGGLFHRLVQINKVIKSREIGAPGCKADALGQCTGCGSLRTCYCCRISSSVL